MKKQLIVLLILCICLLCACNSSNSKKRIIGHVITASSGTDSESTPFVIVTNEGKEIAIVMDTKTFVMTLIDGIDVESFRSGKTLDVMITAECDPFSSSLTTEEGKQIKAYKAKNIQIDAFLTKDALKLADGRSIDIWNYSDMTVYQQNDKTELLVVRDTSGPDNVFIDGIEGFNNLGEEAQANIQSYYKKQGLLYDVNIELEKVYTYYKNTKNKSKFSSYTLSQEISPTFSNEKVMFFLTSLMIPKDANHVYNEIRLGAAFNRETGKHISNWELFSCSVEEAKQTILDLSNITDPVLRAEMETVLRPEYIILYTDNLEVYFPEGTLPSQEYGYILALDYDKDLCKILNDWVIPNEQTQR